MDVDCTLPSGSASEPTLAAPNDPSLPAFDIYLAAREGGSCLRLLIIAGDDQRGVPRPNMARKYLHLSLLVKDIVYHKFQVGKW